MPQLGVRPPQPSPCWPQFAPRSLHESGLHPPPHTPRTPPPPQVPASHVPQSSVLPQPSDARPHIRFWLAQVRALQFCTGGTSGAMQEARSNSMYSKTFSCAVIWPTEHWLGHVAMAELAL